MNKYERYESGSNKFLSKDSKRKILLLAFLALALIVGTIFAFAFAPSTEQSPVLEEKTVENIESQNNEGEALIVFR